MKFDLISDLHLDEWSDNIKDWRGLGTSLACVIAGDVSRDSRLTYSFLKHLCDSYKHVIFIDGNHEHHNTYDDPSIREAEFDRLLGNIRNMTYLRDGSCIIDGTAFIGANGWWTFDFPEMAGSENRLRCMENFCQIEGLPMRDAVNLWSVAQENAEFLCNVTAALQEDDEVSEIVVVTHTVPRNDLIYPKYGDYDWSKMGNSSMNGVLMNDPNGKISTWCFGHYHDESVDTIRDGVRYISHPRGRESDNVKRIYYPKMVDTIMDTIKFPDR